MYKASIRVVNKKYNLRGNLKSQYLSAFGFGMAVKTSRPNSLSDVFISNQQINFHIRSTLSGVLPATCDALMRDVIFQLLVD